MDEHVTRPMLRVPDKFDRTLAFVEKNADLLFTFHDCDASDKASHIRHAPKNAELDNPFARGSPSPPVCIGILGN